MHGVSHGTTFLQRESIRSAEGELAEALLKRIAEGIQDDWTAYSRGGRRFPADGFDVMAPDKAATMGRFNVVRRAVAERIIALQETLR